MLRLPNRTPVFWFVFRFVQHSVCTSGGGGGQEEQPKAEEHKSSSRTGGWKENNKGPRLGWVSRSGGSNHTLQVWIFKSAQSFFQDGGGKEAWSTTSAGGPPGAERLQGNVQKNRGENVPSGEETEIQEAAGSEAASAAGTHVPTAGIRPTGGVLMSEFMRRDPAAISAENATPGPQRDPARWRRWRSR